MAKGEKVYWLDSRENVTKLFRGLCALGLALALADLVVRRHDGVGVAEWFGFYAVYGFVACVALVLTAKALRRVLKRPEDYYDR
jgi:hypothetical protein